jgi:hypothetical protein
MHSRWHMFEEKREAVMAIEAGGVAAVMNRALHD